MSVKRLGNAAVLAQKMRGFESCGNADGEVRFGPAENARNHLFTHPQLPHFLRRRLRAQQIFGAAIVPTVGGARALRQFDQRLQRFAARRVVRGLHGRSVQCARPTMPLPKSILCSACKKTYPEGWKRCPYCGFDEIRARQDGPIRKYMQKKLQEFEQRTGKKDERRGGAKPPRPDARPPQQQQRERGRDGRPQHPQRGGGGPQQQRPPQQPRPPQQQSAPQAEGERTGRRRRRRRGGNRGEESTPTASATSQQQQPRPPREPRPPRPPQAARPNAEGTPTPRPEGDGPKRRRRFRRRRGGGGGGPESAPPVT